MTRGTETHTWLAKLFERSVVARRVLLFVAMLGTCMLIGDGILTPAISGLVLSFFHLGFVLLIERLVCFSQLCWFFVLFTVLSAMDGVRAPFPKVSKCKFLVNAI